MTKVGSSCARQLPDASDAGVRGVWTRPCVLLRTRTKQDDERTEDADGCSQEIPPVGSSFLDCPKPDQGRHNIDATIRRVRSAGVGGIDPGKGVREEGERKHARDRPHHTLLQAQPRLERKTAANLGECSQDVPCNGLHGNNLGHSAKLFHRSCLSRSRGSRFLLRLILPAQVGTLSVSDTGRLVLGSRAKINAALQGHDSLFRGRHFQDHGASLFALRRLCRSTFRLGGLLDDEFAPGGRECPYELIQRDV